LGIKASVRTTPAELVAAAMLGLYSKEIERLHYGSKPA
jgi:hypothetical protein